MDTQTLFLLTTSCRDNYGRFEITLFASTSDGKPVKIVVDTFRPLFFVNSSLDLDKTRLASERKSLDLQSMANEPVDCLYFASYKAWTDCAQQLRSQGFALYESDVHPLDRYLMERFVTGTFEVKGEPTKYGSLTCYHNPVIRGCDGPVNLRVMSIDIETNAANDNIYSIACHSETNIVFIIGSGENEEALNYCENETIVLKSFYEHLKKQDPDVLIGWSVIDFDLRVLQKRSLALNIPFMLGRENGARVIQSTMNSSMLARIPGRVVIDVPMMLRANFFTFDEYSLNFVATAMLGKQKEIVLSGQDKIDEINRQFASDKKALAHYNLQDTVLTKEIFDKAGILPNAIERSKRSGHLLDRTGGSIAAFDYLYLPRLHRAGYVAGDSSGIIVPLDPLPGGYVLEPAPGLYENVLVFDFRSLYPSIIMTFKIDPLGLIVPSNKKVKGPVGPAFAVDKTILPIIIEQLLQARAEAKKANNPYLSQAIKILMNSFYGVLGATSCRFFSSELASTITRTGQYILKQTITFIEKQKGFPVIYGDTDSLFVNLGKGKTAVEANTIGSSLAKDITKWLTEHLEKSFGVTSVLQMEYQSHFRHFFMPAVRGGTHGSKKHYCGTIEKDSDVKLIFKGMESVRSDWTDLAKDFQNELYTRVFSGRLVEDFILETMKKLKQGHLDQKLVYKKRLRKLVEEYTTSVPPHVQAARLMKSPGHIIKYLITAEGPQPLEKISSPIDYNHYIECQLRPIADSILEWFGTSFDRITSGQQDLFG